MLLMLRLAWAIVTALIIFCVGLAFLPHSAASRLTATQKFLSKRIAQRKRGAA